MIYTSDWPTEQIVSQTQEEMEREIYDIYHNCEICGESTVADIIAGNSVELRPMTCLVSSRKTVCVGECLDAALGQA